MDIIINGDIDERTYMTVKMLLNRAKKQSEKRVDFLISSVGGDVFYGLAIVDAIRELKGKGIEFVGKVEGLAASMAMMILQACDVRIIGKNSWLMLHGPSHDGTGEMDIRESRAEMELLCRLSSKLADMLLERCTSDNQEFKVKKYWEDILDSKGYKFYDAEEAVSYGLVDIII